MMAADSTVRNTLARLMASFQINVLAASRLQCSVARIWAACDPSGWSLATPVARAAAASGASGVPDSDRAPLVSWSVVPITDLLERQMIALAVESLRLRACCDSDPVAAAHNSRGLPTVRGPRSTTLPGRT